MDKVTKKKKEHSPEWKAGMQLLKKLLFIGISVTLLFVFVFGIFRYPDDGMEPALHSGDLVMYYRLDKRFHQGELCVVNFRDRSIVGRVVAREGDVVEIDEHGLRVNGSIQVENFIYEETLAYEEGVTYPVTVEKDEVFILGDHRKSALDSRLFGCVGKDQIQGKVFAFLRRRNF